MYESDFINKVEEGREYKLGVLKEFLEMNNYILLSETINCGIGYTDQKLCKVVGVIDRKYECLSNINSLGQINYRGINGIIFAEFI